MTVAACAAAVLAVAPAANASAAPSASASVAIRSDHGATLFCTYWYQYPGAADGVLYRECRDFGGSTWIEYTIKGDSNYS
ncbi:hypothetical protein AB0L82_35720 [Nocardia sp. NPDC052001]|uniref:hypothetical protein n=1 Tax=Nocardia sp. NPDC052001 TaxID=3154853 RepID=UPI00343F1244